VVLGKSLEEIPESKAQPPTMTVAASDKLLSLHISWRGRLGILRAILGGVAFGC
jgi:hypothetical protein